MSDPRLSAYILSVLLVIALGEPGILAQSPSPKPTPNPADQRGIGIQSATPKPTPQTKQQTLEAKPELVLQTGYNSSNGATRLVFSMDGRLLATTTLQSGIVKLWETATGRELRNLATGSLGLPATSPLVAFSVNGRLIATSAPDTSIKIWDITTGQELRSIPHGNSQSPSHIHLLAFGPDDRTLVAVSDAIRVWDLTTGRELRSLTIADLPEMEGGVAISQDRRQLALIVRDESKGRVKQIDLTTGNELTSLSLPQASMDQAALSFTADGRLLFSAVAEDRLRVWELMPKPRERVLAQVVQNQSTPRFSSDGRLLALGDSAEVKIWDAIRGSELSVIKMGDSEGLKQSKIVFVGFSEDGKTVATGGFGQPTTIWETKTAKQLIKLSGRTNLAYKVAFSADGKSLFSGGRTSWDLRTGRGLRLVNDSTEKALVFPGPDGRFIATSEPNSSGFTILQTDTDRRVHTPAVSTNREGVSDASFSRDSSMLAVIYVPVQTPYVVSPQPAGESKVAIYDTKTGQLLHTLDVRPRATSALFSNDGKTLALLNNAGQVSLWETSSGRKLRDIGPPVGFVSSIAFSPDNLTMAIGDCKPNQDRVCRVLLWDLSNDRESGVLQHQEQRVTNLAFSRDGRLLSSSSADNTIKIWDVEARRELRTLTGHTANINSMDFGPDSSVLASAGNDGSTFIWDTRSGEHLLTLISLDDGIEWIVITPQGIFDGTPTSWNQILWRYNQDTFNVAPIEWFFTEFYYPGLLADVFAGKQPRVTDDVSRKDRRQPVVKLSLASESASESVGPAGITSRNVKVRIRVDDAPVDKDHPQGTGARDMRIFRNGSLVRVWHGDVLKGRASVTLEEKITVSAGVNRFTAYAFNRDNVKSKDAILSLTGADNLRRAGTVYIVAIGLNEYSNPQYNLKYAVADAQSFSQEVRERLSQLSHFDRIQIVSLINENATKTNILSALQRLNGKSQQTTGKGGPRELETLKRVEPEDAVVVYFAGHGTAQGQRFYLIPHDLGYRGDRKNLDDQGLQTILSHSISDLELEDAFEGLNCGRLLLLIDACNSGQALEADEKRRGPMNSKGLAQLAYEKGMYILTAAQSYQAAIEAAQFGHGLLTFALIEEALKTDAADTEPKDGFLSAREWMDFATERVPQLQQEKMKQSRGIGLEIAFTEGEQDVTDPQKRSVQRPRVFYRRELEAAPLIIARTGGGPSSSKTVAAPLAPASQQPVGRFSRWIDLQTATLGGRYRFVQNSQDVTVVDQVQSLVQFRGRLKFDRNGNYSLNAGVFTGNSFVVGFNDTGIGTGDTITNLYLKQLFFSAKPISGLEIQYGGLYFNRGESTEITTYDNDGFLIGERIVIKKPENFFFDEISATYGFLGDLNIPNINKRWHRLKQSNYHQFLVSKRLGERAAVSGDYTFQSGVDTLRQALRISTPEFKAIDFFRVEVYERVKTNPEAGIAAYAEKSLLKKRLTVGGGYADIDRFYGGLNGDRFGIGRRFFVNGSYKLTPEFTVSTFYTRAFKTDFPLNSKTRFEVLFSYNLLKTLQKARLF